MAAGQVTQPVRAAERRHDTLTAGARRAAPASSGSAGAICGWCRASPTCPWVGGRRAACLPVGSSLAWVSATAVHAGQVMAVSAVWAVGRLVGRDAWPPGQPPPPTAQPPPAPARRASATHQPRMVGLLVPFGDALLGQRPAQPGMLVVHGSHPFPQLSRIDRCWLAQDGPGARRPNLAAAIRTGLACSLSLVAGPTVARLLWPATPLE
jgi:hypothetical protein